jgi:hypothetical protein
MALASLLVKALSLGAIVLAIHALVTYLRSPLKNIPGPFLARFSNVWRLFSHYNQTHIDTQRALHKKHGDFVRLGPNTVSIADASLLKTIYSTRGTFKKVSTLYLHEISEVPNCKIERLLLCQRCTPKWPPYPESVQYSQQ